jgi:hypothetical protein
MLVNVVDDVSIERELEEGIKKRVTIEVVKGTKDWIGEGCLLLISLAVSFPL